LLNGILAKDVTEQVFGQRVIVRLVAVQALLQKSLIVHGAMVGVISETNTVINKDVPIAMEVKKS